jgi:AcrR family transcriptional regulator
MARTYTKTKRAENQEETRLRIVEAAVDLHGEIGPAKTTISMIADRAGVQRHTVYAYFPDERTLFMACSGLHGERHPLPTPETWDTINDPSVRLRKALSEVYTWFDRNEAMAANVLRDAEQLPALREVTGFRFGAPFAAIAASVSAGLRDKGHAALHLALSFHTWRTLVRESGMPPAAAVEFMANAVLTADR